MFNPNVIPLFITLILLPPVFVHGGLLRELRRKFDEFFKSSKPTLPGVFYDNCNLCTFGPCTPIIWPSTTANFDGSVDAEKIMTAYGNPERLNNDQKATVGNLMIERSAPQRTAIAEAFTNKYKKLIVDQLDERMDSIWPYYKFIEYMSYPLPKLYETQFRFAIKYQSYENSFKDQCQFIIVEMLTTLPKCLMDKVVELYNSVSGQDLIPDLDKALTAGGKSPEFREVIKKLIQQKKGTNEHASWIKALTDAYRLKSAVISRKESRMKEKLSDLFTTRSIPQIKETIVVYENLRHGDKDFQSFSGDVDMYTGSEKDIYTTMTRLLTNKPLYYAEIIEGVLRSGLFGTYERRLLFLIAGRFDIDLKDIIDAYNQKYETSLKTAFEAEKFKKFALALHPILLNIVDKASRMPA